MRIKISKQEDEIINKLRGLYNFKSDGVIPRIALAYSLQTNVRFEINDFIPTADGREFRDDKYLFGTVIEGRANMPIYKAIMNQHYEKDLYEEEFLKLIRLHINHGLLKLDSDLENMSIVKGHHINFLMKLVKNGLDLQNNQHGFSIPNNPHISVNEYNQLLPFSLGYNTNDEEEIIFINDLNEFDSRNIAVAGMAGSGKTQLIKDILFQVTQSTNSNLKFIYFDYKGEGSSEQLKPFLDKTNTQFIDILNDGFNFNPLRAINLEARQKVFSIKAFVDTVGMFIPSIGVKQKQALQTVLVGLFENNPAVFPTLANVSESLEDYYVETKQKPDSMTAITKDLASGLFLESKHENIIEKNIYLNLPPALSDTLRQLCVFLLLRYFNYFFSSTNDVEPIGNIMPLRYIIVIDEAHVYLKNRNARKALEDLLRVMRSKGVIVVMLSQGVEDYKTKEFDFASQVKLPICLNIQNKDYKLIKAFLGTPRSEHKLQSEINKLESGKGIININEPQLLTLRQFWKTISKIN